MAFQREKQNVSASDLLQALADGEEIKLNQCVITGQLDVNRLFEKDEKFQTENLIVQQDQDGKTLSLAQSIVFDKCTFEENVVFSGPWTEPESMMVEFKSDVVFNSSVFKGQARFRNAAFLDIAGFDGCSFEGVATFKNARIKKDAKFRTAAFSGYTLFGNTAFESSARFNNTHFVKGVNFTGAVFAGQIDFSGVYSSSRAVPVFDQVKFAKRREGVDESFWRFVKQSAQEAGYYQLAGECFYNERCARLRHKIASPVQSDESSLKKLLRFIWSIRLVPEIVFGKWLFGYGERPVRVLAASAFIILICASFYSQPDSLIYRGGATEPSFLQSLYFSTITFTTLGYGDLYPAPNVVCRAVAMFEAVAGGCLMALFVVCLAKRFSRG